jgi:hypothetical protein
LALGLLGTVLVILGLFTLVNTWINPLWVTPSPWTDESFAEHRQIYRNLRTAKAGLARSQPWDVALVGSSRVAIGLDPDIPQWGDLRVVNLGISAGSITENAVIAEYVVERQPELKRVILGLDLTDLTSEDDKALNAGFFDSPFSDRGNPFERELRYMVGFSSAEASYKTLKARDDGVVPPYTAKGHWAHHRSADPVRTILKRDSIPFAIRYVRLRKAELKISERKVEALRRGLRACLGAGVEMVIIIPPNHAAYLVNMPLQGDPDPFFMVERRKIVEVVAEENAKFPNSPPVVVWDFNDFHPLNAERIPKLGEGPMKYWVDGTHALETLGTVMLSRIHGWPLEDPDEKTYGRIITPEDIDERETEIKDSYDRYLRENPGDVDWVQSIARQYQNTSDEEAPR